MLSNGSWRHDSFFEDPSYIEHCIRVTFVFISLLLLAFISMMAESFCTSPTSISSIFSLFTAFRMKLTRKWLIISLSSMRFSLAWTEYLRHLLSVVSFLLVTLYWGLEIWASTSPTSQSSSSSSSSLPSSSSSSSSAFTSTSTSSSYSSSTTTLHFTSQRLALCVYALFFLNSLLLLSHRLYSAIYFAEAKQFSLTHLSLPFLQSFLSCLLLLLGPKSAVILFLSALCFISLKLILDKVISIWKKSWEDCSDVYSASLFASVAVVVGLWETMLFYYTGHSCDFNRYIFLFTLPLPSLFFSIFTNCNLW